MSKSQGKSKTKKEHNFKPGVVAVREVRQQQKGDGLVLARAPFERLVREKAAGFEGKTKIRFSEEALFDIQSLVEEEIVTLLSNAYKFPLSRKALTLTSQDIYLAKDITRCGSSLSYK
jgi:histone H3